MSENCSFLQIYLFTQHEYPGTPAYLCEAAGVFVFPFVSIRYVPRIILDNVLAADDA